MSRPSKTPLSQSLDDESEFERGSDSFAGDANQDAARRLEDTDRDSMKHIRPRDLIKSAQHNSLHSLRSVDISDPARPSKCDLTFASRANLLSLSLLSS